MMTNPEMMLMLATERRLEWERDARGQRLAAALRRNRRHRRAAATTTPPVRATAPAGAGGAGRAGPRETAPARPRAATPARARPAAAGAREVAGNDRRAGTLAACAASGAPAR